MYGINCVRTVNLIIFFFLLYSGLMYKDSYAVRSVPEVMARSGSALLHFFSDDAYNMSGFNISYAINACPSRFSSLNCSGKY